MSCGFGDCFDRIALDAGCRRDQCGQTLGEGRGHAVFKRVSAVPSLRGFHAWNAVGTQYRQ